MNKKPEYQPTSEEIIEEIGDVIVRLHIYAYSEGMSEELIDERIMYKLNKFLSYLKDGKYVNGI